MDLQRPLGGLSEACGKLETQVKKWSEGRGRVGGLVFQMALLKRVWR